MAAGMLMFVLPGHWWGLALTFIPTGIGMSLGELATSVAVSNRSHAEQQGQAMGLYRGLAVGSGSWRWWSAVWCCWRAPSGPSIWRRCAACSVPSASMVCAGRRIGGSGSTSRWKPADGITERREGATGTCIVAPTLGRYGSLPCLPARSVLPAMFSLGRWHESLFERGLVWRRIRFDMLAVT